MKTQIIEIKTGSTPINQIVEAVQGDSGRVLRCIISDMSIPAGSTARFYAVKPSGAEIYNDCAIDGQEVILNMTTQMLAEVGTLNGQIEVTNSGKTVTSFSFCVNVIKNIKSNSAIESSNEFTALDNALKDAEGAAYKAVSEYAAANGLTTGATPEQVEQIEQNTLGIDELKSDIDKLNDGGLNLKDEVIAEDINNWLNEHPEATTTVKDHSLTIDKMVVGTLSYVTPEMFGAMGDGRTDDSNAIQEAFNYGCPVLVQHIYKTTKTISVIGGGTSHIYGSGKITTVFEDAPEDTYSTVTALKFTDCSHFKVEGITIVSNACGITFSGCKNFELTNVKFECEKFNTLFRTSNIQETAYFRVNNVSFNSTSKNSDGLHFDAGCHNFVIDTVYGVTGDDFIALNCVEGIKEYQGDLEIYNGTFINTKNIGFRGVRIYGFGTFKVHDLVFTNCEFGCGKTESVMFTNSVGRTGSDANPIFSAYNITFNDCIFRSNTQGMPLIMVAKTDTKDIALNNCKFITEGNERPDSAIQFHNSSCGFTFNNMIFKYGQNSKPAMYFNVPSGTVINALYINVDRTLMKAIINNSNFIDKNIHMAYYNSNINTGTLNNLLVNTASDFSEGANIATIGKRFVVHFNLAGTDSSHSAVLNVNGLPIPTGKPTNARTSSGLNTIKGYGGVYTNITVEWLD